jgi:hypothetical protein
MRAAFIISLIYYADAAGTTVSFSGFDFATCGDNVNQV